MIIFRQNNFTARNRTLQHLRFSAGYRGLCLKGMTILLVEQNARLAMLYSRRMYVLDAGQVTISAASAELIDDHRVQQAYLGE